MALFLADKVLVTIKGRCYGQRILLTNMYRVSQTGAPLESANLQLGQLNDQVANKPGGSLLDAYRACLQGDYLTLEVISQVIAPVRIAYRSDVFTRPGLAGAGTVANDSGAVTLRTAKAGRNQRSTKHIGPVPDGVSQNGLLMIPFKGLLSALGESLSAPIQIVANGLTFTSIVYHKSTSTSDDVVNWIVGDQSRVQRRRTVGVGE
jgi:hypothetical protein